MLAFEQHRPSKPLHISNVALCPSEPRERFPKHCHARLCYWIVVRECVQEPDAPYPFPLLRPCHQRSCRRTNPCNEFVPFHLQSLSLKIGAQRIKYTLQGLGLYSSKISANDIIALADAWEVGSLIGR